MLGVVYCTTMERQLLPIVDVIVGHPSPQYASVFSIAILKIIANRVVMDQSAVKKGVEPIYYMFDRLIKT